MVVSWWGLGGGWRGELTLKTSPAQAHDLGRLPAAPAPSASGPQGSS